MLTKVLELDKKSIISVVGAGGKTTFVNTLAKELRSQYRVLLTTSTKIYIPKNYDYLIIGSKELEKYYYKPNKGIYVYGKEISSEQKLIGVDIVPKIFDHVLIEADGAKNKEIKGWNDYEPVIISDTSITVGIISIEALGIVVNNNNVHRLKRFINITNTTENALITINDLIKVIIDIRGLFKNALGRKILFINKVETDIQVSSAKKIINYLKKNNVFLERVIIGSLKNMRYMSYILR